MNDERHGEGNFGSRQEAKHAEGFNRVLARVNDGKEKRAENFNHSPLPTTQQSQAAKDFMNLSQPLKSQLLI